MQQLSTPMAKKRRSGIERNDIAARIDRALVSKAKLIAAHQGKSVAEVLSEAAKPAIDKAYAAMLRDLEAGKDKP